MVDTEVSVGASPAPASDPDGPRRTRRFGRRPPDRSWLIGLAAIPLLMAIIGYGADERPVGFNGPSGQPPTLRITPGMGPTASSAPVLALSLVTISRNGNSITLVGDLPNADAKAALIKSLKSLITPGVNVVDQTRIDPGARALDFTVAEPVFTAGATIPDFNFKVEKETVTLGGTAVSADLRAAVERAAVSAWPDVNVNNKIAAKGQLPVGAPNSTPTATPTPAGAGCNDLPAAIKAATGGAIAFGNDGVSLTPNDTRGLIQVADRLKACPTARVTVSGYTDNAGSEGINIPLSTQRANTVAEFLIANGVARDHVTAKGLGSVNPIASNDTAEGRLKNRRVEITVG